MSLDELADAITAGFRAGDHVAPRGSDPRDHYWTARYQALGWLMLDAREACPSSFDGWCKANIHWQFEDVWEVLRVARWVCSDPPFGLGRQERPGRAGQSGATHSALPWRLSWRAASPGFLRPCLPSF
jgi:hypothetical protein